MLKLKLKMKLCMSSTALRVQRPDQLFCFFFFLSESAYTLLEVTQAQENDIRCGDDEYLQVIGGAVESQFVSDTATTMALS